MAQSRYYPGIFLEETITTILVNKRVATKLLLFTTLLSLGGLPPFIGFLPK
jgi:NADH:ubiquinone oxidoreductase subunit 2 (subunit N)